MRHYEKKKENKKKVWRRMVGAVPIPKVRHALLEYKPRTAREAQSERRKNDGKASTAKTKKEKGRKPTKREKGTA